MPQEEGFKLVRVPRRRKARRGYKRGAGEGLIAAVPAIELDLELLLERTGVKAAVRRERTGDQLARHAVIDDVEKAGRPAGAMDLRAEPRQLAVGAVAPQAADIHDRQSILSRPCHGLFRSSRHGLFVPPCFLG